MKTLAELKREAKTGNMYMMMIERYGSTEIIDRLKGVRPVIGCNTVALKLRNQDGQESEMRLESAALTEYTGDMLIIYNAGRRDLTAEEKAVLNQAEAERKRYQEQNPYSESFWHMKAWYKNCPFPYLAGFDTVKGKRYENSRIVDSSIKGDAILKYKVCFASSIEEATQKLCPEPEIHQMDLAEYMTA